MYYYVECDFEVVYMRLVDRLHGGLAGSLFDSSICLDVIVSRSVNAGVVNRQTKRDELVQTVGKVVRLFESEAGSEEGSLVEQHGEVANGGVVLVLARLGNKFLDDRVAGVELERLLGSHVLRHA